MLNSRVYVEFPIYRFGERAMTRTKSIYLALLAVLLSPMAAWADLISFDLNWSGESLGYAAVATGSITLDDAILNNPGYNDSSTLGLITDFSITVSGATLGNGTWDLAEFFIIWDTDTALDLTRELVGQATSTDPWGTSRPGGTGGDFNIFYNFDTSAPVGSYFFEITTFAGEGDRLLLTSFRPSAVPMPMPIPEPGTLALLGLGLVGIGMTRRRKTV